MLLAQLEIPLDCIEWLAAFSERTGIPLMLDPAPAAALRALPVREIPPDVIQRQTPRMIEGAKAVCRHLDEIREEIRGRR